MTSASFSTEMAVAWFEHASVSLSEARDDLTALDAARGDADHGVNMSRGFEAVAIAVTSEEFDAPGAVLLRASEVLRRSMGGTTGPLWSFGLRRIGTSLGSEPELELRALADALCSGADTISALGGAKEGDNTMLDVLFPAARELGRQLDAGAAPADALRAMAHVAERAAAATADQPASRGRASYLGERAKGQPDPGAASASLIVAALREAVRDLCG